MARAPKSVKQPNTLGFTIVAYLKRHKTATTEQLAKAGKVSVSEAYSRAYWMAKKEGILAGTGKGASKEWRLTAKAIKQLESAAEAS